MGRSKRIRILESGKFVLVESGIPGFRIRNPSSSDKESGIHGVESRGAFHLVKISGISGSAVNGTRLVGSSHWKIPRKSGKSKKVVPFSRLEFPNGMSCSIDVFCSLYQFQVHGRAPGLAPGITTKWNNFLPIGNSPFATTEISGVFS